MKIEKFAIEFFDMHRPEHGGHGFLIAKLFRNRLAYLRIDLCRWKIGRVQEYYDGWHTAFYAGFFVLSYCR